jgi:hypothetical protein
MRLLCDRDISNETAAHLKSLGHDIALIAPDCLSTDLVGRLEIASEQNRVLLSYDVKLSGLMNCDHAGAILLRFDENDSLHLHPRIERVFQVVKGMDIRGRVITVDRVSVRARLTRTLGPRTLFV